MADRRAGDSRQTNGRPPISADLLFALNSPIRRNLLRALHRTDEPKSGAELSGPLSALGTTLNYHFSVLSDVGAVELAKSRKLKGFTEKYFSSLIANHETIQEILADTELEDCGGMA